MLLGQGWKDGTDGLIIQYPCCLAKCTVTDCCCGCAVKQLSLLREMKQGPLGKQENVR